MMDWQKALAAYLIGAGTVGRPLTEIVVRFRHHVNGDILRNELEAMQGMKKAQKFEIPSASGKGKKTTVWRATTKLKEGWP